MIKRGDLLEGRPIFICGFKPTDIIVKAGNKLTQDEDKCLSLDKSLKTENMEMKRIKDIFDQLKTDQEHLYETGEIVCKRW